MIYFVIICFSYFYDVNSNVAFTLTYIGISISCAAIVRSFEAIDSLFIGMCIHARAGYIDLQDMILELDEIIYKTTKFKDESVAASTNKQLHEKMKKCIDFYDFLIK